MSWFERYSDISKKNKANEKALDNVVVKGMTKSEYDECIADFMMYRNEDDYHNAMKHIQVLIALFKQLVKDDPVKYKEILRDAYVNKASLFMDNGEYQLALNIFQSKEVFNIGLIFGNNKSVKENFEIGLQNAGSQIFGNRTYRTEDIERVVSELFGDKLKESPLFKKRLHESFFNMLDVILFNVKYGNDFYYPKVEAFLKAYEIKHQQYFSKQKEDNFPANLEDKEFYEKEYEKFERLTKAEIGLLKAKLLVSKYKLAAFKKKKALFIKEDFKMPRELIRLCHDINSGPSDALLALHNISSLNHLLEKSNLFKLIKGVTVTDEIAKIKRIVSSYGASLTALQQIVLDNLAKLIEIQKQMQEHQEYAGKKFKHLLDDQQLQRLIINRLVLEYLFPTKCPISKVNYFKIKDWVNAYFRMYKIAKTKTENDLAAIFTQIKVINKTYKGMIKPRERYQMYDALFTLAEAVANSKDDMGFVMGGANKKDLRSILSFNKRRVRDILGECVELFDDLDDLEDPDVNNIKFKADLTMTQVNKKLLELENLEIVSKTEKERLSYYFEVALTGLGDPKYYKVIANFLYNEVNDYYKSRKNKFHEGARIGQEKMSGNKLTASYAWAPEKHIIQVGLERKVGRLGSVSFDVINQIGLKDQVSKLSFKGSLQVGLPLLNKYGNVAKESTFGLATIVVPSAEVAKHPEYGKTGFVKVSPFANIWLWRLNIGLGVDVFKDFGGSQKYQEWSQSETSLMKPLALSGNASVGIELDKKVKIETKYNYLNRQGFYAEMPRHELFAGFRGILNFLYCQMEYSAYYRVWRSEMKNPYEESPTPQERELYKLKAKAFEQQKENILKKIPIILNARFTIKDFFFGFGSIGQDLNIFTGYGLRF